MEEQIKILMAKLEESNSQNTLQSEQIKSLLENAKKGQNPTTENAKKVELPKVPGKTVKVGKCEFKFSVASFKLPGSADITLSEDAAIDKDILAKILAVEGQGILIEVV